MISSSLHLNWCLSRGSPLGTSTTAPQAPHWRARSISSGMALEKTMTFDLRPREEISLIASASSGETAGMPASILSTPTSSSIRAMAIFSSFLNTTPGVCSPSRSVAS